MSVKARIDPFRVLGDPKYAASLSAAELRQLARDPVWLDIVADEPERMSIINARLGVPQGNQKTGGPRRQNARPSAATTVVGSKQKRVHGMGVVSHTGAYLENIAPLPNMAYMKLLRSPHPHAKILSIDTSAAEALAGVIAVLHRFNAPEQYLNARIGGAIPGRYLFPEVVFQVGAPIVALAATDDHIADEALRLIVVEYEVLPAVLNFKEAALPTTPNQWESEFDGTIIGIPNPFVRGEGGDVLPLVGDGS